MKTAEELIADVSVLDENVLAEAARQPALFIDAARYRVAKMRKRSQAVAELEAMRARLALAIRAKRSKSGDKITEAAMKEKLAAHSLIQSLQADVEKAYEAEEFSKLLLEAFRMRRDGIRIIAEGQIAEGLRGSKEIERAEQRGRLLKKARALDTQRNRMEEE